MAAVKKNLFDIRFGIKAFQQYRRGMENNYKVMNEFFQLRNDAWWNHNLPRVMEGSQDLGGPPAYVGGQKMHGSFEPRYLSYHMMYRINPKGSAKTSSISVIFDPHGRPTRTGRRSVTTVHRATEYGSQYRPKSRGYPRSYPARSVMGNLQAFVQEYTVPFFARMLREELDRQGFTAAAHRASTRGR